MNLCFLERMFRFRSHLLDAAKLALLYVFLCNMYSFYTVEQLFNRFVFYLIELIVVSANGAMIYLWDFKRHDFVHALPEVCRHVSREDGDGDDDLGGLTGARVHYRRQHCEAGSNTVIGNDGGFTSHRRFRPVGRVVLTPPPGFGLLCFDGFVEPLFIEARRPGLITDEIAIFGDRTDSVFGVIRVADFAGHQDVERRLQPFCDFNAQHYASAR